MLGIHSRQVGEVKDWAPPISVKYKIAHVHKQILPEWDASHAHLDIATSAYWLDSIHHERFSDLMGCSCAIAFNKLFLGFACDALTHKLCRFLVDPISSPVWDLKVGRAEHYVSEGHCQPVKCP